MKTSILLALVLGAAALSSGCGGRVSVAAGVAGPPVCPYGYYETPPYYCAPDGYYGPEWFNSGVFIGAGPWYHGRENFYGHVDHDFDYRKGYSGRRPERGEQRAQTRVPFRGNAMHDSRGREAPRNRK